ncbi:cysteine hydrolase family protein [Pediococcus acidilactici]|uniref:Isochorismatase family protein n=1 Tax=Pediococcus acidilactici DSM 20284 TaxID=862514 RepID=E0NDS6_PEDAC|nr:cysteine hydrolase family protein [Pediococcus acidilactici]AZP90766.1 cysteine hydrolase [Pediococcus acidilactici]EFL96397.1 isochorismatase family protein [Pediococcus acidilactici DSM 20284]KRN17295.1 isochorismatase transposase [Pediococcus acidilactici]MDG9739740.1 cysteine hydrolase family protein [Pediococcus acidilactici]NKZ16221.1 cysteine hydrolase [Pediococcus acidilactici]
MAQVLIVIDMQRALSKIANRNQVISNINERINKYRENNLPIVFVQHTEPGMEVASEQWRLFEELNSLGTDTYFNKIRPDAFYQTGLEAFLKMNHLNYIEICGAQVEFCVDTTIRVAFHLGFKTDILIDGVTTINGDVLNAEQIKKHHANIWDNRFGKLITVPTPLK